MTPKEVGYLVFVLVEEHEQVNPAESVVRLHLFASFQEHDLR